MVSQERQIMSFYSRKCAKCSLKYCSIQNWGKSKFWKEANQKTLKASKPAGFQ